MELTVIIKALNEEQKIEACITSILREVKGLNAEVILVDSCSKDKTIEISKKYPIKIIQFKNHEDINCGAAVQLGYQVATGDYIYLIDGDMEMAEGFLKKALVYLKSSKDTAGVSGLIKDRDLTSASDRRRKANYESITKPINSKSLGGGGLYKKIAIDDVHYFGHSALESCEELELGVRLISRGWKLTRLPEISVYHTGHGLSDFALLLRYFKTGRFKSIGRAFKSALGKNWFWNFSKEFKYIGVAAATIFIALVNGVLSGFLNGMGAWCLINLFVWLALSIKKRDLRDALVSILTWYISLSQFFVGFLSSTKKPDEYIEYYLVVK
ncbi:glycosyltransferase [Marinobacterium rhizophilum]|uniref:Glycosyltransferase n=1 Tax=Marinobacterium rhizophilum TaxID=420402 RepID=A0ABY5HE50_9GAMM|nr:glycosyltransferase [Marinobacterium rhizophilum]UTW10632.1 glycosyltransferase [Marinobacterium rhizophilum]